jgi:glucosamine-6-phosphate deaminase
MEITVCKDAIELGQQAGKAAGDHIRNAIAAKGRSSVILATGASQFETLKQLVTEKDIDWSKVTMFHLDEYIGLPVTHKASFRKYLQERFLDQVKSVGVAYLINGEGDPKEECKRLNAIIAQHTIDVALVGIGENGHLAFNDPPADFDTEDPYIIVTLDEPCRRQQMNEGWFATPEDVPAQAISMSVKQIMRSVAVICSVPDKRKAAAVKNTVEQPVNNLFPASILKEHPDCKLYLDRSSAAALSETNK